MDSKLMETRERHYHLAQLNVARLKAALGHESLAGFVSQLDAINAAAERARGFVWRLQTYGTGGSAATVSVAGDPRLIVTLSVWESVEALSEYVYRGDHAGPLRNRAEWFEKQDAASLVLWWIPRGARPRVEQGLARLKYLRRHGPTKRAFTFRECFPPPDEPEQGPSDSDDAGGASEDEGGAPRR